MKVKKFLSILLVLTMLAGTIAGCGKKETEQSNKKPSQSSASTVSVTEIKKKYGETDEGKVLPLYNLDPNEPLAISLKYTPENEREVFSIHTDEKCLEASEVQLMWSASSYMPTGPKTYEVKPIMAPLSNSNTEGLWGNVSNYYIKFNYDITAEEAKKLDEPVIVPMSIKSPAEIPDVKYEVENGNFILKWKEVKGATSYKIYQRQVIKLLETTNVAPKGKEEAFVGNFPSLVAEVNSDTLLYSDWLSDGKDGMTKVESSDVNGGYVISRQNQGVNGEYYVTAVVDGKESLFSAGVSTTRLALPKEFASGTSLAFNTYESVDDLPKTVNLVYVDGTERSHGVTYEAKSGSANVTYKIDGTSMVGYVTVKENADEIKVEDAKPENTGGAVSAENNIPQNAPASVPTVNDGKTSAEDLKTEVADKNDTSDKDSTSVTDNKVDKDDVSVKDDEKNNVSENIDENTDAGVKDDSDKTEVTDKKEDTDTEAEGTEVEEKTIVEEQIENTEKVLKEANKETVEVSDDTVVNADNAAEEYLALCMVAGKTEISLSAFPEIQNWSILSDVFMKVMYQNPMILGVRSYGYDYGTMTLTLEYDYDASEMAKKQEEIKTEGKKIIGQIIEKNMTEEEKRRAIYDYLESNTTYDDAALESAEANNFMGVDDKYKDSFSTYGILVKKVGVCQSYAYAFDYLCELAGLECVVVTGAMYGFLPHAWNRVLIDGEWLITDVTNNETSTGVEDFMYENPDKVAEAFCYVEDDMYYRSDEAGKYKGASTEYSKYKDCMVENKDALYTYVKENVKVGEAIEFLVTYPEFNSDDVVSALRDAGVKEIGSSMIIGGYVWCEIVK